MYLFYRKINEEKGLVNLIYNIAPSQNLIENRHHIIVDELEEPEVVKGKNAILYCNPSTNEAWYEYEDRELTAEEKIKELEEKQEISDDAILSLMDVILMGGM